MQRIQRKRTKGYRMPENSIYVGRPTRWGNPYSLEDYDLATSLDLYTKWLDERLREDPTFLDPLVGKDLACWCALDKKCHADILLERTHWFYKCDVCGCVFPIWWVSDEEWKAGGFEDKHVCKKCFETAVPSPHYYSVDEYIDAVSGNDIERVQKKRPDWTPDEVKLFVGCKRIISRANLLTIWR